MPMRRLGEPVTVGEPPYMCLHCTLLPAQIRGKQALTLFDQSCPTMLFVTEPKPLFGGFKQRSQEASFPFVPDTGANCADVDDGKNQQKSQALGALHELDEILDGLGIREIPFEGCGGEQQMMTNEPRHRLAF